MKSRNYTRNLKEEILREVQEVGNASLVSRKHGISKSTIFTWIKHSNKKDEFNLNIKTSMCNLITHRSFLTIIYIYILIYFIFLSLFRTKLFINCLINPQTI
jgi:hypothetical protein